MTVVAEHFITILGGVATAHLWVAEIVGGWWVSPAWPSHRDTIIGVDWIASAQVLFSVPVYPLV